MLGLVNNNFHSSYTETMHHILNGGLPKIVTANFHGQAIHSHQSRVMGEYLMCDKVLSGIIRRNDGCNDIIWAYLDNWPATDGYP